MPWFPVMYNPKVFLDGVTDQQLLDIIYDINLFYSCRSCRFGPNSKLSRLSACASNCEQRRSTILTVPIRARQVQVSGMSHRPEINLPAVKDGGD